MQNVKLVDSSGTKEKEYLKDKLYGVAVNNNNILT
jgi:hypothetical protein